MNYAEDRLDRRIRYEDGVNGLWKDYSNALQQSEVVVTHELSLISADIDTKSTGCTKNTTGSSRNTTGRSINHELLGRTLRDIGWNYHAIYHYGQAWCIDPISPSAAGDYAQMLELAGYPDISCITLLSYYYYYCNSPNDGASYSVVNGNVSNIIRRRHGNLLKAPNRCSSSLSKKIPSDPSWILQKDPIGDCGCGHIEYCCNSILFIPIEESIIEIVIDTIQQFYTNYQYRNAISKNNLVQSMSTINCNANEILRQLASYRNELFQKMRNKTVTSNNNNNHVDVQTINNETRYTKNQSTGKNQYENLVKERFQFMNIESIPELLRFWYPFHSTTRKDDNIDDNVTLTPDEEFPALLQLLLVKVLYLVFPTIASYAVVGMEIRSIIEESYLDKNTMAKEYKSHWAYYIFIRALVLGERIKPHRQQYQIYKHVPVWDTTVLDNTSIYSLNDDENRSVLDDDDNVMSEPTNSNGITNNCDNESEVPVVKDLYSLYTLRQILIKDKGSVRKSCSLPLTWILPKDNRNWVVPNNNRTRGTSCCNTGRVLPLFVIGDSHVLSLGWQTIQVQRPTTGSDSNSPENPCTENKSRILVPVITTGLKAWHVQSSTRFFTFTCLKEMLHRIVASTPCNVPITVVVSCGEIDCREGMGGPLLAGYNDNCLEHIQRTVQSYVHGLYDLVRTTFPSIQQVLVMPVAPHAQLSQNGGRIAGQLSRRQTMYVWNTQLRSILPFQNRIYFLDYVEDLIVDNANNKRIKEVPTASNNDSSNDERQSDSADRPFILNPVYNADTTHMNNSFLPHFLKAIQLCGCNLDQL